MFGFLPDFWFWFGELEIVKIFAFRVFWKLREFIIIVVIIIRVRWEDY